MIPIIREARWRGLLPGQRSELHVLDTATGESRLVLATDELVLEAPNWLPASSPLGERLVVNAAGRLYSVRLDGLIEPIDARGLVDLNNDHVPAPDGTVLYCSCETDGHVHALPLDGGAPHRITPERPGPDPERPFGWFALGVSPDGTTLGLTGAESRGRRPFVSSLYLLDLASGETRAAGDPDADAVGCEFSPDGSWLYFSSELRARRPGDAQLYRMRRDGSDVQQLTDDERVNWFPKPSPDGETVVYLSFPPGTVGHEANVPVLLRSIPAAGGAPRDLAAFTGGQGTLNVTSWEPGGTRFAYVRYPLEEAA